MCGDGLYRGHAVTFEIVDGWAVIEGDIVLGRAEELIRALPAAGDDTALRTKGLAIDRPSMLWPKGPSGMFEIPYTIEIDPLDVIPAVVAEFNTELAGFMQFVPRTTQADYVAFVLNSAPGSACFSAVGRVGGRQVTGGEPTCRGYPMLHELGHAIGLWHEQSRPDRDQYVIWFAENNMKNRPGSSRLLDTNRQVATAYDYASTMHYRDFAQSANWMPTFVTIPQGIPIGVYSGFTAGDLDTIRRLYGSFPTSITVTSNPPGLQVAVDGVAVTTPQTFNWALNSVHTIDVAQATQTTALAPYVFARWNIDLIGDGIARRIVTVAPGPGTEALPTTAPAVTVYTANFVRLFPFQLTPTGDTAAARAALSASVSPPPQSYPGLVGSFFPENQLFILSATVAPGFSFAGWFGSNVNSIKNGRGADVVLAYPYDFNTGSTAIDARPRASSAPLLRFRSRASDGVVDGVDIQFDDVPGFRTPQTSVWPGWKGGEVHQVTAVPTQTKLGNTVRYLFKDWDGVPANPITVTVPVAGESSRDVTANFTAQYAVDIAPQSGCAGNVSVTPVAPDGFYDYGEKLDVAVTPAAGWVLTRWTGDVLATAASQTLTVTGQIYARASFNTVPVPFAVTGLSRAFVVAAEPEFDLTVYGTGFTPATRVFVNGTSRVATFLDANRLRVHLASGDLAGPREVFVQAFNALAGCNVVDARSIPVRAMGYTWPATTPVIEFYHAGLDHYFVTANSDEIAKLDSGTLTGWSRTGKAFKAFPADSMALVMLIGKTVCRYYGNPAAGLDSHFYSAAKDECDAVKQKFPEAWVFESSDVFQIVAPDRTTGACPDGTIPVYRLFNQRAGANHRYTTDTAVRAEMIAKGYLPEGYGRDGVAMCALE